MKALPRRIPNVRLKYLCTVLFGGLLVCGFQQGAAAQEGYRSAFDTVTRGESLGRMPQLYGSVTALCCEIVEAANPDLIPGGRTWWHFNARGQILSVDDSAGLTEFARSGYRYDYQGRLTAICGLRRRAAGRWDTVTATTVAYDDATGLIALVREHFDEVAPVVRYRYASDGFSKTFYSPFDKPLRQYLYQQRQLRSIVEFDDCGNPTDALVVTRRTAAGQPCRLADIFEPDNPALFQQFDYDPFGNPVGWTDEGVELSYDYRYDIHHNWVEMWQYEDGDLLLHCRRRIFYQSSGDSAAFSDSALRRYDLFYEQDHPTGCLEIRYPNGDCYLGNLVDGRREGEGEMLYADSSSYSGGWHADRYHGYGLRRLADRTIACRWDNGRIVSDNQAAEIHYRSGARYQGELSSPGDSCRYHGRTTYPDGGSHRGEYACELFDGFGTHILADGTRIDGFWEWGRLQGSALIVRPNLDRHYVTYDCGVRQPRCVIEYINGDLYEGETDAGGTPSGYGRFTNARGRVKEGYFAGGRYKGTTPPHTRSR